MPAPLQAFALWLSVMVAASDLYARRVPNGLLLGALFGASLYLALAWPAAGAASFGGSLLGLAAGLVALLPFYLAGWMGAGDVKFFAVLGFLLGWPSLLPIWVIASLLGGVHAVGVLLARRWAPPQGWRQLAVPSAHWQAARQGRQGMPYAAYLAAGAVATMHLHPSFAPWAA